MTLGTPRSPVHDRRVRWIPVLRARRALRWTPLLPESRLASLESHCRVDYLAVVAKRQLLHRVGPSLPSASLSREGRAVPLAPRRDRQRQRLEIDERGLQPAGHLWRPSGREADLVNARWTYASQFIANTASRTSPSSSRGRPFAIGRRASCLSKSWSRSTACTAVVTFLSTASHQPTSQLGVIVSGPFRTEVSCAMWTGRPTVTTS